MVKQMSNNDDRICTYLLTFYIIKYVEVNI